jgi:hypothetical protein
VASLTSERTIGEQRFEAYLNAMGYPFEFEKEYPGKQKRPDYTVAKNGTFLFDVKDADPNMPPGFNQFEPHEAIIERINAGRKKFKEFKEFPCCVVLQNNGNVLMNTEHPVSVLGAMYGKIGFSVPLFVGSGGPSEPTPPPRQAFLGGAQFLPDKNTTISALISLRRVAVGKRRLRKIREENPGLSFDDSYSIALECFGPDFFDDYQQGVIVWENIHARLPLPSDLFDGPFDERWGLNHGEIACIFCGTELAALPG